MKKLLMIFALCVVFFSQQDNVKAQPLQNFEAVTFPPTNWTLVYTGTQYWTRQSFTSYLPPQTGAAKFNFFNASAGTVQSLISPSLVPSVAGDSVKLDLSYHTYTGGEVDTLYIDASTDNGSTYTNVVTLLGGPNVGTGMVTWAASSSSAAPTLASQWGKFGYALPVGTNKIRFRAASAFGNNLYIDNIQTKPESSALANDVSTTGIVSPNATTLTLPVATIAPKATFANLGLNNQASFPVTFLISGPVNYSKTQNISLNSGSSVTVTFDSTFSPVVGTYNVTVYTGLVSDQNRANDTLKLTFNVVDPNFGSGTGGLFFSNSISSGAPSKPEVCWADTSGGITLCRNGDQLQAAVYTGTSLDDGYWRLGNLLPAGYKIRINGNDYDSIFVSTNGILGLTAANTTLTDFSPGALPDATQSVALYPLWKDFDLRAIAGPSSYIKVIVKGYRLYVFWLARVYNSGGLSNDVVYFNAIVELVNSPVNSNVIYQYGDASKGTTASFVTAVNNNTLADHVIGMQSGAAQYCAYRQRITTLSAFGPIFANLAGDELAVELGPDATKLNNKCSSLNLSVALEVCPSDVITAYLYNSSCVLVDQESATLTGSGPVSLSLSGVSNSPASYYIKVVQKNSLTIWSNPVSFSGNALNYNFTTGLDKVFGGNNMVWNGTKWAMISGDVNQDGAIDAADLAPVENDAGCGDPGCSSGLPTDLSCDDFVDAGDIATVENNQGVFEDPPCSPSDNVSNVISAPYDRMVILPEVDKRPAEDIKPLR